MEYIENIKILLISAIIPLVISIITNITNMKLSRENHDLIKKNNKSLEKLQNSHKYVDIITAERIKWLNLLKTYMSEYLESTSNIKETDNNSNHMDLRRAFELQNFITLQMNLEEKKS